MQEKRHWKSGDEVGGEIKQTQNTHATVMIAAKKLASEELTF
jgi:hypothetical protein